MGESEAEELRQEIIGKQVSGRGRKYGVELRTRAVAYLWKREAMGATAWQVSREVGVPWRTLLRWGQDAKPETFRRVTVGSPKLEARRVITVYGPRGLRIEGLSPAELAELLRALE
jgi:hypothetical protein